MGGLLHSVQQGGFWVGPQPAQAPPCCINLYNSPRINASSIPIIVLLSVALRFYSAFYRVKELTHVKTVCVCVSIAWSHWGYTHFCAAYYSLSTGLVCMTVTSRYHRLAYITASMLARSPVTISDWCKMALTDQAYDVCAILPQVGTNWHQLNDSVALC